LVRLERPLTIRTLDLGTRRAFATAFTTAALALPS
jgi:hypothetical protein